MGRVDYESILTPASVSSRFLVTQRRANICASLFDKRPSIKKALAAVFIYDCMRCLDPMELFGRLAFPATTYPVSALFVTGALVAWHVRLALRHHALPVRAALRRASVKHNTALAATAMQIATTLPIVVPMLPP
jgi:hypothetical protein